VHPKKSKKEEEIKKKEKQREATKLTMNFLNNV